ncbi:MAG: hypothetical protein WAL66_06860, partial [Nitrososphaeraceae archaeon]
NGDKILIYILCACKLYESRCPILPLRFSQLCKPFFFFQNESIHWLIDMVTITIPQYSRIGREAALIFLIVFNPLSSLSVELPKSLRNKSIIMKLGATRLIP